MRGEEGLLTNFPKFYGDRATSTMFSQCFRKTYGIDLVYLSSYKIVFSERILQIWLLISMWRRILQVLRFCNETLDFKYTAGFLNA